jgi:phosphatidate cytidylyltransferase
MSAADRWGDLRVRVVSATVLIVLGIVEVWLGGTFFWVAVVVLFAVMIWELAGLSAAPGSVVPLGLAGLAWFSLWLHPMLVGVLGMPGWAVLLVPPIGFLLTAQADARVLAGYALALMLAGVGFMDLRMHGAGVFLWLVALVVASDTMGYFAGRLIGGPKFWPSVSPKKTWAGAVAGWIGAGLVGVVFAALGVVPWAYALVSPLIGFASQMGDIVESWIKRRAGAKDSSRLIPGHGGVLDRFDALVGAVLAVQVLGWVMAGPV